MKINSYSKRQCCERGFTLLELMITVAVIAILASIAYPSYQESVLKGRRAEARAALTELMQQQERFMTQNNTYQIFAAGATGVPFITTVGDRNGGARTYQLSTERCDGGLPINVCIRAVATPVQADPRVGQLRLTSTGVRDCTGTERTSNPRLCWP